MKSLYTTEILLGAAVTLITAAIIGVFSRVSDLSQSDARDQIRLDTHDRVLDDIRRNMATMSGRVEDYRLEATRARAACEDWMRKHRKAGD